MELTGELKKGKRGAIAKAISIIENDPKKSKSLIKKIFKSSGKAIIIGITGPAGAGKSSLINKTAIHLKKLGNKIRSLSFGIIAWLGFKSVCSLSILKFLYSIISTI